MSRTIPTAIATALAQPSVELFQAVEMSFSSGSVRMWSGYGDRIIQGKTYLGAGQLLGISGIEESADLSAKGALVEIMALDQSIISLALLEAYQGRPARILFGVPAVNDVVQLFAGEMGVMTITHTGSKARLSLTIESKMTLLQRPNIRRYTQENQILRHPGDNFFSAVTDISDKELLFGRSA